MISIYPPFAMMLDFIKNMGGGKGGGKVSSSVSFTRSNWVLTH